MAALFYPELMMVDGSKPSGAQSDEEFADDGMAAVVPIVAEILGGGSEGSHVLTVSHDQVRTGLLVRWVQQCALDPILVSVALPKGEMVIPMIRNSRRFNLCRVEAGDSFLCRKFARPHEPGEDPFMGIPITIGDAEVPIITRARSYLECLVVGHLDLPSDHRLYVGRVLGGGYLEGKEGAGRNGEA